MRLNRQTDFALRTLIFLGNQQDRWVTTAEISRSLNVPRNHLLKVVNRLIEHGWLEGKRGPSGGVRFRPETLDLSAGEVVRRLEQSLTLVECFDAKTNSCPLMGWCRLAPVLYKAQAAFLEELDKVKIKTLLPKAGETGKVFASSR